MSCCMHTDSSAQWAVGITILNKLDAAPAEGQGKA